MFASVCFLLTKGAFYCSFHILKQFSWIKIVIKRQQTGDEARSPILQKYLRYVAVFSNINGIFYEAISLHFFIFFLLATQSLSSKVVYR